ncbi:MAG: DUF192 domain-containing protein [Candidatus Peregrinibacteria bacterium]
MKKGTITVGLASVLLVVAGAHTFVVYQRDGTTPIALRTLYTEHRLRVSLATTPEEQRVGLMWVKKLRRDGGMLFAYEQPHLASFWMQNMEIPLDILFIGADHQIKRIVREAYPCLPNVVCPRFVSPEPVQYVLEVTSGYAKDHQVEVGDELIL